MQNQFWKNKKLEDFTEEEWEAICINCGKCCLVKLIDDDTEELYFTNVVCKYYDRQHCRCSQYQNRCTLVPSCLKLTKDNLSEISWMPKTCAYRCLLEGQDLPQWHPLLTGKFDPDHSIKSRCIPETEIDPENIEDYITDWEEL